jgi:hypothetical protein
MSTALAHHVVCSPNKLWRCFVFSWGRLACRHPYKVILVSLLLCGAACAGFAFYSMETDDELLWTPFGSPVSSLAVESPLTHRVETHATRRYACYA